MIGTGNYADETSPSLLVRVRNAQDLDSWREFERLYRPIVRKYCVYRQLQAADAEDVTQEVMLTVSQAIKRFEYDPGKGRFRAWLGTITANQIKKWSLRQKKQQLDFQPTDQNLCQYSDPDGQWIEFFSEAVLTQACNNIRPFFEDRTWRCFKAAWIENLSPRVIADDLEIAVHAVYVNKARVLRRLEAEIRLLSEDLAFFPE